MDYIVHVYLPTLETPCRQQSPRTPHLLPWLSDFHRASNKPLHVDIIYFMKYNYTFLKKLLNDCSVTSVMSDSATPCTVALQAPLYMGFSQQG